MAGSWDYVIVGGGSAGAVLAARLSEEREVRVLLLEAGGSDRHPLFHIPAGFARMTKGVASWGWSTVPQRHMNGRVLRFTTAKVIGGGSTINAQVYTRGNRADYDAWEAEEGCPGWNYRSVLPYFRRAEDNARFADDFHGQGGPLAVSDPAAPLPICTAWMRAAQELGIPYNPDFNGRRQAGVGFYQLTQRDRRRASVATAYLGPARSRSNLAVRLGVQALRILVERGRATGVEITGPQGRETVRAAREIIVASGTIGSPRLLLLSGIGPPDELRAIGIPVVHALPGVGRNLHDHLDLFTIWECSGDHTYDRVAQPHRALWAGLQYLLFRSGPAASSLFETGGFWYADPAARTPDIQFHLGLGSGIEAGVARLRNPGVTLNATVMRPQSRGTVRLASANPATAPLIDPNYWAEPGDLRLNIAGLRLAREIMRQPALKPFLLAERLPAPELATDADLFAYGCAHAKTDHHPAGTCRMGTGPEAVVDPELRVHGIEGLRVCDASVMPRVNSSNTNAPVIMLGERGADLIRGRPLLAPAVFAEERNERLPQARRDLA
jgi:choline dehydrogenase-like flavoprotein